MNLKFDQLSDKTFEDVSGKFPSTRMSVPKSCPVVRIRNVIRPSCGHVLVSITLHEDTKLRTLTCKRACAANTVAVETKL